MYHQQALIRYQAVTASNVALLDSSGDAKDLIRQLLMRILEDELGDRQRRGCLVANASLELAGQDEAIARLVAHNFQRLHKALERLIRRGQQSGDIPGKSPRALAWFFVNTIQGLRVLGKGSPSEQRRQCLLDVIDTAPGYAVGPPPASLADVGLGPDIDLTKTGMNVPVIFIIRESP